MSLLKRGVNIVLDGQWGSTGKGKLCGLLGTEKPNAVVSSFGPNAGHTYIDDDGNSFVFKGIPSSACTATDAPVYITPDSVIKVEQFLKEAEEVGTDRVMVDRRVAVVTEDDAEAARITGHHLAGTMQGTGHAIAKKILRLKNTKLAGDILPKSMVGDVCEKIRQHVRSNHTILFEMSQGFDLSVNHGHDYPYLTSRDITVGAAINSMGISHHDVSQVVGSIRTYPIRVGNIDGGYSGPHWPDQTEVTWDSVTMTSGSSEKLLERTTVTKRVRRVFTFSLMQLRRFVDVNKPDYLFLNFMQYITSKDSGKKKYCELSQQSRHFVEMIESECRVPVKIIGTGAALGEVVVR